jgi:hypothetical protein
MFTKFKNTHDICDPKRFSNISDRSQGAFHRMTTDGQYGDHMIDDIRMGKQRGIRDF